jgi:D-alanyl-D-alanine carboxypeptidase
MKALAGKVVAKTGSLTYDNSLSGYVTAANGEVLVFSIICNDSVGGTRSTALIDEIVDHLAEYPSSPSQAKKPTKTREKQ